MRGRIRSIKPDLFKDEELWDLAQETGLPILQAFEGLWCFADKEGRFEWRPRALKTDILPYWDGDFARVLDALITRRFVVRYEVNGRAYGVVRTFKRHQVINNREAESELPAPPDEATAPSVVTDTSTRAARVLVATTTEPARDSGVHEWNGNGNGTEGSGSSSRAHADGKQPEAETPPQRFAPPPDPKPVASVRPLAAALSSAVGELGSDRERALGEAETLVRREFAKRFEAAEAGMWTRQGDPGVQTLARWLLSLRVGTPEANCTRLLDAFFADAWAQSEHFPIQHLARYPQKYFEPRSVRKLSPQQQLDELGKLNTAEMERGKACNWDLVNARAEQMRALQKDIDREEGTRHARNR